MFIENLRMKRAFLNEEEVLVPKEVNYLVTSATGVVLGVVSKKAPVYENAVWKMPRGAEVIELFRIEINDDFNPAKALVKLSTEEQFVLHRPLHVRYKGQILSLPVWASYLAKDKNGWLYVYSAKPVIADNGKGDFFTNGGKNKCLGKSASLTNKDWKDSLVAVTALERVE